MNPRTPCLLLLVLTGCHTVPDAARPPSAPSTAPPAAAGVPALVASAPAPAPEPPLREVFPHVRVDRKAKLVEFDAQVPLDAREPDGHGGVRRVYLEVLACAKDSREHETLVVTPAKPSHIHAALLLVGLEPGAPGSWDVRADTMTSTPPKGPPVVVNFAWTAPDGRGLEQSPARWVINANTGKTLAETEGDEQAFVFAGSIMVRKPSGEVYGADREGNIVGLHTFGTETVAWRTVYSPEESVQDPEWIMNPTAVPDRGTTVLVRIRPPAR